MIEHTDGVKNDCPSDSGRTEKQSESSAYRKQSGPKTGPRDTANPGTGGYSGQTARPVARFGAAAENAAGLSGVGA